MIQNLVMQFLKKLVFYGLIPNLITFLTYITMWKPENPDQITQWIFMAVAAGCTGLIGLLKRWATYDPSK